ncbi:MAG: class II D-tagatose-bisphosphate aldolase, non-catalytic subunit [Balneolales bacterium]|nr:class II D-tagatose-bisphosphate aldolase, non-catalytic subunit [Balneolales bacterium]
MKTALMDDISRTKAVYDRAGANSLPLISYYLKSIRNHFHNKVSLLAVCPNSEAVARAALHAAQEANAPILYAATLNQVDTDGGYTGWTPSQMVDFLKEYAATNHIDTPILPCLDHGGPWLKDKHAKLGLTLAQTMEEVKRSLEACLDAGYALLHIDPTVDRSISKDAPIPIEIVVERTIELIQHAESYRLAHNLPKVDYEVGTEEVHGGLANLDSFKHFLHLLDSKLKELEMEDRWPCFVVGKVGTDLHTTYFEPQMARDLTKQTLSYNAMVKGHYSDYVDNPEDYPLSGMGAANVGPDFTEEEFFALQELIKLEKKLGFDSKLEEALEAAVNNSNRWQKWLQPNEEGFELHQLDDSRKAWIIRTCSRYIWTDPHVINARKTLYDTIKPWRDGDAYVINRIKIAIMKYYHNFNLIDFNNRILAI